MEEAIYVYVSSNENGLIYKRADRKFDHSVNQLPMDGMVRICYDTEINLHPTIIGPWKKESGKRRSFFKMDKTYAEDYISADRKLEKLLIPYRIAEHCNFIKNNSMVVPIIGVDIQEENEKENIKKSDSEESELDEKDFSKISSMWSKILNDLSKKLNFNSMQYDIWIKPMKPVRCKNRMLEVNTGISDPVFIKFLKHQGVSDMLSYIISNYMKKKIKVMLIDVKVK